MKKLTRLLQLGILVTIIVVMSCKKDFLSDNTCNVSNPLEDLPWLKNIIDDLIANPSYGQYSVISMAKYNGQTVFLEGYCNPAAEYIIPVWDCSGNRIGIFGQGGIDETTLSNRKSIWKSENSLCN